MRTKTNREKSAPAVSGVWLRTGRDGLIEVLVEMNGQWRLLRGNGERYRDGEISHIWEVAGMKKAVRDPLTT